MKKFFIVAILIFSLLIPCVYIFYSLKPSEPNSIQNAFKTYKNFTSQNSEQNPESEFLLAVKNFKNTKTYLVYKVQYPFLAEYVDNIETALIERDDKKIADECALYFLTLDDVLKQSQNMSMAVAVFLCSIVLAFFAISIYYIKTYESKKIIASVLNELEKERSRISMELHDTIIQNIRTAEILSQDKNRIAALPAFLSQTQEELRRLCSGLSLYGIESAGLEVSLLDLCKKFSERTKIKCECVFVENDVFENRELSNEQKLNIYRIVQEALNNAEKHSGATWANVSVRKNKIGGFVIFISDNGSGFDVKAKKKNHFGLEEIKQRAKILDAKLSISSSVGNGTQIRLEM